MNQNILAVDDSDLLHRMYDLMLVDYRSAGVEIEHAYNGKEALELLEQEHQVGLILLDVQMPVMGGLEFLSERQKRDGLAEIPVIVISTRGREEDTTEAMNRGADGYLTKPFQPADLRELIGQLAPMIGRRAKESS